MASLRRESERKCIGVVPWTRATVASERSAALIVRQIPLYRRLSAGGKKLPLAVALIYSAVIWSVTLRNDYDNWHEEEFDCPACKWHGKEVR